MITAAFDGQNWLITPTTTPTGPAAQIVAAAPQTWLVVLSGVAVAKFTSPPASETILIAPEVSGPIEWAIANYGAPKLTGNVPLLQVLQWAPFAAVGSVFDESRSVDSGFDINTWRPNPFATQSIGTTGTVARQIFTGIQVDITVRDNGPLIYRLPYQITLIAHFASAELV